MTLDEFIIKVRTNNPHLHILDYPINDSDETRVYCEDCGGTFVTKRFNLRKSVIERHKKGCPICGKRLVVKGVNDVATVSPWMVEYFVDKKQAEQYSIGSSVKVETECPICHSRRKIAIHKIHDRGYRCATCGDRISYPNKFGRAVLKQLPIENWICEYHAKWLADKSYDNYFEYNGNKYILEMDGEQHTHDMGRGRTVQEEQANDAYKDLMASQHGIEVIRIDCYESDKNYIQKNILSSRLSEIFDLSQINWELCAELASKNIVREVCEYYNTHNEAETKEIAQVFNINLSTVVVYLKQGASFGLCNFSSELARQKVGEKNHNIWREKVNMPTKVLDPNGNLIGIYKNNIIIAEELNKLYPDIGFKQHSICNMLASGNGKTIYKGFYLERI